MAAEPLVADPVAIAFGPDGKLWVAEMADYPSGKTGRFEPGGRVVFLEDLDRDGNFDRSTVFLDNLPFPTGVLPWRKGVLICAAPDILYAEDTNGDGKADKVEKLYSGFGTENYQGRVNSLQYGLDGWVYGSCGLFGGNIMCARTGKTIALGDRDFRIKPDTGELEPATGRTQQGRVRDDRGNWFGCDNSNLIRHYVLEDHYLRRNPHVAYPNASVNVASSNRVFPLKADAQRFALSGPPGSVTAACGLGIYRDDLLGKDFTGNAFTCESGEPARHTARAEAKRLDVQGRARAGRNRERVPRVDGWLVPAGTRGDRTGRRAMGRGHVPLPDRTSAVDSIWLTSRRSTCAPARAWAASIACAPRTGRSAHGCGSTSSTQRDWSPHSTAPTAGNATWR